MASAGDPERSARPATHPDTVDGEEVLRRLVHASGTAVPALYLLGWATWRAVTLLLVASTAVALVLEVLRLFVGLDWAIYEHLTREYEQDNLAGYALYLVSSTAVAATVAPRVAVPAILMLTIADPISGLLGSGELRAAKRTFVLLATFGVCLLLASPFLPFLPALFGALAATAADGLKPVVAGYVVDDNLTIPPAAAGAMLIGLEVLPYL
ncbi:MAG: dolichol kinase [Haloarculaceae archaeon]